MLLKVLYNLNKISKLKFVSNSFVSILKEDRLVCNIRLIILVSN